MGSFGGSQLGLRDVSIRGRGREVRVSGGIKRWVLVRSAGLGLKRAGEET